MLAHIVVSAGTGREAGDTRDQCALVGELVQHTPALTERGAHRGARDQEHRHRIRPRLRKRGERVADTGAGDDECGRRMASSARVAIGGEGCILLVADQHVPQPCQLETAIQLDVVQSRNPEDGVDAVGGKRLDYVASDGPGSRIHALEMLAPATQSKNVRFSTLVDRISGEGAAAWLTHYAAVAALE